MTPRPESRIKSLEKRATDIEASIEELSSDQAEELKAIRLEIKQLNDGMMASFKQIGDTFMAFGNTMAAKEDLSKLEARIERIEATMTTKDDIAAMESRINANIATMKEDLLDAIKQLWQQKGI